MEWFNNMKISAKLITSFIIVAIISGVVGVIGITNITKINNNDTILYENMTVPLTEVADMARWFQRSRVNARDLILHDDIADIQNEYTKVQDYLNEVDALAESFEKTIVQEEVRKYFRDFENAISTYRKNLEKLLDICLENRDDEAFAFTNGDLQDSADEVRDIIDKLLELKVNGAKNQSESNDASANSAVVMMIGITWYRLYLAFLQC